MASGEKILGIAAKSREISARAREIMSKKKNLSYHDALKIAQKEFESNKS
jgi:hypothetical protein